MAQATRLLLTMGDVAGIGPEIIARSWPELVPLGRPLVVGDPAWLERGLQATGSTARVVSAEEDPHADAIPCLTATAQDLSGVIQGRVNAAAGRAAYDFLCAAIDRVCSGCADAIVTAPLNKEALHAAGLPFPGHTEILAERTGTASYAMLLYCDGLAVGHVTLHMALRDALRALTRERILRTVSVLDTFLRQLLDRPPRIAVAALNPHGGESGIFGDEEAQIIRPAVDAAIAAGMLASGPWPCDTLFVRARAGEFDGVAAMYHDQGHIAMKLAGGLRTVNVTAGLPFARTSPAHGTAYDIVGQGVADATGLVEAARLAVRLAQSREGRP